MASAMVFASGVDHCRAVDVDHLTFGDNFKAGLLRVESREHLRSAAPAFKLILPSIEGSLRLLRH